MESKQFVQYVSTAVTKMCANLLHACVSQVKKDVTEIIRRYATFWKMAGLGSSAFMAAQVIHAIFVFLVAHGAILSI